MKNWDNLDENIIRFRNSFSEKYTLTIDSESKGVNVEMRSKIQIRWDFRVLAINEGSIEIELLLLDNTVLEANNPIVKDLSAMSQVFGKMYSELHLLINQQGEIITIINISIIQEKWSRTKQDMQALINEHPELKDVMLLNDSIFLNPEKIKKAIVESEFFLLYFHLFFGNAIPTRNKRKILPNVLNTAYTDWLFSWSLNSQLADSKTQSVIELNSEPMHLSEKWYQEAYKSFAAMIDIRQLRTSLSEHGLYRFDKTNGKLLEARLVKEEIADKDLFCKIVYTIKSNSYSDAAVFKVPEPALK